MRRWVPTTAVCMFWLSSSTLWAQAPTMADIVAMHWLPQTAAMARNHTLTTASLMATTPTVSDSLQWSAQWDEIRATLRALDAIPNPRSDLSDGHFAQWADPAVGAMALDWRRLSDTSYDQWMIWQAKVARVVPQVWAGADEATLQRHFGPMLSAFQDAPADVVAHARAQARRIMRMSQARSEATQHTIEGSLLLAEARFQWAQSRYLDSAWLALEGMEQMLQQRQWANARYYSAWLNELPAERVRSLRSVDSNLPVIMALLMDAARHLASPEPQVGLAQDKLSSAWHYLALFIPNGAIYLDQPVRDQMRAVEAQCGPNNSLSATQVAECINTTTQTLLERINTDELVGATAPLSPEFLARELDLVSWQRARYLDSYVDWLLNGRCAVPAWFNALEWHLGIQWLRGWASEAPVAVDSLMSRHQRWSEESKKWLECWADRDQTATDLIALLLNEQAKELRSLGELIRSSKQNFYASVTLAGADVDLDQTLNEQTQYRNTNLRIAPCDVTKACGSRVELSIDQALLNMIPDGYWLAEQLKLGQVRLCYDEVKWIDREMRSARDNDAGVANYNGRLSFELDAFFEGASQSSELIFSQRLETSIRQNYFFGPADDELLAIECPHGLEGQPIESALPEEASGLVPPRLTYFTSIPTPTATHLLNHWAQGEAWREVFTQGDATDVLYSADDEAIRRMAETHRLMLAERGERTLATRLASFDDQGVEDPMAMTMLRIDTLSRLIRRILELHYGPIIRSDDAIRARVSGSQSLLSREDIRRARDMGIKMIELSNIGQQRSDALFVAWAKWPAELRRRGLPSPEMQTALIGLKSIENRSAQFGVESPAVP